MLRLAQAQWEGGSVFQLLNAAAYPFKLCVGALVVIYPGKYGASYFSCAIRKTEAQAMQCYLGAAQRDLCGAATHVPSCFPPPPGITQHPQDFFQDVHLFHEAWLETAPAQMALRSVSILWQPESFSSLETMGIA